MRPPRCHKVRYRDEIAAKLALAKLQRQDKPGHTERRAYHHHQCRGWHLTSLPGTTHRGSSTDEGRTT